LNTQSRFDVWKLTTAALLVALDVIFTRFLSYMIPGNLDRLSLQFVAHGMAGLLLGPVWGGIVGVVGDISGMLVNSSGLSFYPLLTLSAGTRGVLYGLFLYRKPLTLWRTMLACIVVTLVVDLGMNPVWMKFMYGQAYTAVLMAKIPIRAVWAPATGVVLFLIAKALKKPLHLGE